MEARCSGKKKKAAAERYQGFARVSGRGRVLLLGAAGKMRGEERQTVQHGKARGSAAGRPRNKRGITTRC